MSLNGTAFQLLVFCTDEAPAAAEHGKAIVCAVCAFAPKGAVWSSAVGLRRGVDRSVG